MQPPAFALERTSRCSEALHSERTMRPAPVTATSRRCRAVAVHNFDRLRLRTGFVHVHLAPMRHQMVVIARLHLEDVAPRIGRSNRAAASVPDCSVPGIEPRRFDLRLFAPGMPRDPVEIALPALSLQLMGRHLPPARLLSAFQQPSSRSQVSSSVG